MPIPLAEAHSRQASLVAGVRRRPAGNAEPTDQGLCDKRSSDWMQCSTSSCRSVWIAPQISRPARDPGGIS